MKKAFFISNLFDCQWCVWWGLISLLNGRVMFDVFGWLFESHMLTGCQLNVCVFLFISMFFSFYLNCAAYYAFKLFFYYFSVFFFKFYYFYNDQYYYLVLCTATFYRKTLSLQAAFGWVGFTSLPLWAPLIPFPLTVLVYATFA